MQNGKNNEESKTNLMDKIKSKYNFDQVLSFLQKDKLVEFYKSPNRNFREKIKQTSSFNDIFDMVYPIYADEMLIKRNKEIYLSLFEDIFESDLSILKNKLKTLNQTAIDQKFAYDRKNDEISSQMLLLWMKMLNVEQIAFDILSINEEDFKNRDLQKDLPIKSLDDLYKIIKKIVLSKSQTRVDKIFDKINSGEIYDYKLHMFDFYVSKSGKKFDEYENREMVWLNLCAMLVGNITDRLNDYYNDFYDDLYNDMWAYHRERELIHKLYPLEYNKIKVSIASPSLYQKVRNDLISVCKKLKEIKSKIHSGQVVGLSRVKLKKMGETASDLMFFWDILNCQYETNIFHGINKFLKEQYITQTHNCPKLTPNLYGEYIFMMSMVTARSSDKKFGSKINNEQFEFAKKNAEIAISSTNGREKEFMLVHNKNYKWNFDKSKSDDGVSAILDKYMIKLRPLEDAEIIKPDKRSVYEKWKDKTKNKRKVYDKYFGATELTADSIKKDQSESHEKMNYIDRLVADVSDVRGEFMRYELSESEMADYKILSNKIKSGQVNLNEDSDKENDQNVINETEKQKNNNTGDLIIHRNDTNEKEKSETSKKGIVATEIVNTTNGLGQNLLQQQNNITPLTNSQRNEEDIIDDEKNREPIIKLVSKTTELFLKKSPDMSKYIADCSDFDEVLKLYNGKESDITDLIKNVQVNLLDIVTMFFFLLIRPWHWAKFFSVKELPRLKKFYELEKAKNNSNKTDPQNVSLEGKIDDIAREAYDIQKPETKIGRDTSQKIIL